MIVDPKAPPGDRVRDVRVNGQPLQPDRLYTVGHRRLHLQGRRRLHDVRRPARARGRRRRARSSPSRSRSTSRRSAKSRSRSTDGSRSIIVAGRSVLDSARACRDQILRNASPRLLLIAHRVFECAHASVAQTRRRQRARRSPAPPPPPPTSPTPPRTVAPPITYPFAPLMHAAARRTDAAVRRGPAVSNPQERRFFRPAQRLTRRSSSGIRRQSRPPGIRRSRRHRSIDRAAAARGDADRGPGVRRLLLRGHGRGHQRAAGARARGRSASHRVPRAAVSDTDRRRADSPHETVTYRGALEPTRLPPPAAPAAGRADGDVHDSEVLPGKSAAAAEPAAVGMRHQAGPGAERPRDRVSPVVRLPEPATTLG